MGLSARGLGAAGLPRRARAARWLSHPGCARAWAGGGRGRRGAGVKALRRAAPLSPATRGPRRPARAPAGAHWPSRAQRGGEGPPQWCARARAGARGRARPLLLRQPARRDARSRAAAAARPREARGARARFQPRAHAPHPPISTQIRYLLLFSRQGKVRLSKWYVTRPPKDRAATTRAVVRDVLARPPRSCSVLEVGDYKVREEGGGGSGGRARRASSDAGTKTTPPLSLAGRVPPLRLALLCGGH